MADSRRRIIVDGLEPGALVRFPLILRSVGSAFQPPRLVVALVVILALVLPGRAWDALRGPRLAPGELLGGVAPGMIEREAAIRREIVARWAPLAEVPAPASPAAADVHEAVVATIELLDASHTRWAEVGDVPRPGDASSAAAAGAQPSGERPGPGGAVRPVDPGDRRGAGDPADPADPDTSPGPDADAPGAAKDGPDRSGAAPPERRPNRDPAEALSDSRYRTDRAALLAQRRLGEFEAVEAAVHGSVRTVAAGLLALDPARAWMGTRRLFVDVPVGAWTRAMPMAAVFTPLLLAVWALGGGALSRMAATFVGRGERATIISAVRFARGAWASLLLAPVVPLLAAGVALVPAVLVGLLMLAPGVGFLGGILYGLAVVAAIFAAILIIGLGAGAPLVAAVIATERCDAIDAAQRPYAFLLRRPVHLIAYLALAVVAAAITYTVAGGVAGIALDLAAAAASIAGEPAALMGAGGPPLLGPEAPDGGLATGVGGHAVHAWREVLLLLVAAAVVSAWASATTAAYLLLRQSVDGQDPEEIWEEGMVPGTFARRAPTPVGDHGIPPRTRGSRGPRASRGDADPERGEERGGDEASAAMAAPGPGVPAAVEAAAREEAADEAAESIDGTDLGSVLEAEDEPRPPIEAIEADVADLDEEAEAAGPRERGAHGEDRAIPGARAKPEPGATGGAGDAGSTEDAASAVDGDAEPGRQGG